MAIPIAEDLSAVTTMVFTEVERVEFFVAFEAVFSIFVGNPFLLGTEI
jgi:hypothetical protein